MNAMPPPPGAIRRPGFLVRLFSSIRFGVVLLTLILIYASIMSALPWVRGAIEMTEMEVFQHWSFGLLVGLFCICLSVATWRRIRWNVTNLGVLTVHAGLLMMTGGSVLYFWHKVEGDALLMAPRVELVFPGNRGDDASVKILPEPGETFETNAPFLGGNIKITVVEAAGDELLHVTRAKVRAEIGDQPAREVELSLAGVREQRLDDKLSLRLVVPEPTSRFYDNHLCALYYRALDQKPEERRAAGLPGLPLSRERYVDEGYQVRDRAGRPSPSKRNKPAVELAGLSIPTGWFEHWRMPIAAPLPEVPFDAEVTGYLPYVGATETVALPDAGGEFNPAINLTIGVGGQAIRESLFALDPRFSLADVGIPVEFTWCATAAEREAALAPLAGPHELTVEVKDPPTRKVLAVTQGQKIQIEGTAYELEIKSASPSWPMISAGFQGAVTPMLSVDVKSGERRFNRTVLQRFPQFTQDIDDQGKRRTDGPVDPNIVLTYRGAAQGWIRIVAGPDRATAADSLELAFFDVSGRVARHVLKPGRTQTINFPRQAADFTIASFMPAARREAMPVVEPLDTRRPNMGRQMSAIRVHLTGRGEYAGWRDTRWVSFSPYPDFDARPVIVQGPDRREYELIYSRWARDLGGELALKQLTVKQFPGRRGVESWRSDYRAHEDDAPAARDGAVYTNQTDVFAGWTLFQSGAPSNEPYFVWTILGVGNREGIWPMLLGCVMITLGCLYAFYIKPVLLRRKQEAALAAAAARGAGARATGARGTPELVEAAR